ncbi:MAG: YihY/virulence factor BrkB family protein [Thermomicrobiales bacterium]
MNQTSSSDSAQQLDEATGEPKTGIVAMAKELVGEITEDDVPGLSAEVAYHAIFSIPALFVVLLTLAAIIDNVANVALASRLQEMITQNAPESTQDILESLVTNAIDQADGGTASIGLATALIVALWAGSNGVGALIKAFNRAYDTEEDRSFPKKKASAVLLTIMMGIVVNLAFVLWVFGGQIGGWLAEEFNMGSTFDWVWNLSRIPVGVLVIIFMLSVLYYYGPMAKQEFRWVLPGAVFSTVSWGVLVLGFSIYLRFASPGSAYGALSGLIVFLFFLYLTSLLFLVGAELNAVLARRHDERYQTAIGVESRMRAREAVVDLDSTPRRSIPAASSAASLAVGVVATVGIVLASLLGRRGT